MNEIVPKNKKFLENLDKLESLKKDNEAPKFNKFKEKTKYFGLDRPVMGKDMNNFLEILQEEMVALNDRSAKFYNQFINIYDTFEALDKEYIAGIVGSFNQAIEATKKANIAQNDINNTIEILEKTVNKLVDFNKKVDSEFKRIDSNNWKADVNKYEAEMKELDDKANEIIRSITEYKETYNSMNDYLKIELKEVKKQFDESNSIFLNNVNYFNDAKEKLIEDITNCFNTINNKIEKVIESSKEKIDSTNNQIDKLVDSNNNLIDEYKKNIDEIRLLLDSGVKYIYDYLSTTINEKIVSFSEDLHNFKNEMVTIKKEQDNILYDIKLRNETINDTINKYESKNRKRFIFTVVGISILFVILISILIIICLK